MKNEPKIVCTPRPKNVTPSAVGYSSASAPKPAFAQRTKTVSKTPAPATTRTAIAVYTLDCGHQAVELLRQDLDSAPFWIEEGAVDHLAARDARSLCRLLLDAGDMQEAYSLIESAQANLATAETALTQAEASTSTGSLFVVRDGERLVAATTGPEPTVGLVFYDLKAALRTADAEGEEPKPRRQRRKKDDDGET